VGAFELRVEEMVERRVAKLKISRRAADEAGSPEI